MKLLKRSTIAILLIFSAGSSLQISAQRSLDNQAGGPRPNCAVVMDSMKVERNVLYFYYLNTSSQQVEGVLFDAAYFDNNLQPHHIQVWGNYNDSVRPGKYKIGALNISFLRSIGYTGLSLWPTKVRYRDGSTWDMDPKNSKCGVEQHGKLQLAGTMPTNGLPVLSAAVDQP